jgi:hypothetical protein
MGEFMTSPGYAEVVGDTDRPEVVSPISSKRPFRDICVVAVVENRSFVLILLTLVVLIAVALWQFYSLAWGDSLSLSYHVRSPNVAAAPR